jgi:hypothetical protein
MAALSRCGHESGSVSRQAAFLPSRPVPLLHSGKIDAYIDKAFAISRASWTLSRYGVQNNETPKFVMGVSPDDRSRHHPRRLFYQPDSA